MPTKVDLRNLLSVWTAL